MASTPQKPAPPGPSFDGDAPIPARQARSRRTAERILTAAVDLLGQKGLDELSVAEIAAHAGVSVGGFYARFPGKEALLQYLHGTVIGGVLERARELLGPDAASALGASEIVKCYVEMAVSAFREHRRLLQQISLRSRTSTDSEFRRRILDLNIELHDLFRARLYERLDEMNHLDPRPAIDIALTAISAVMREYVLFAELRPQFEPIDDERLVAELTDMCRAYLRMKL